MLRNTIFNKGGRQKLLKNVEEICSRDDFGFNAEKVVFNKVLTDVGRSGINKVCDLLS